jgi:2-polyprenyl-3-methyl-5-hydroxy-6-metoxy-1,4-benzoquinol methylase
MPLGNAVFEVTLSYDLVYLASLPVPRHEPKSKASCTAVCRTLQSQSADSQNLMSTKISYRQSETAWQEYEPFLISLIERRGLKKVCEDGGGANPLLKTKFIAGSAIDYSVLDISAAELEKSNSKYAKIQADISASDFSLNRKFDLVFSKMLAEHISDAEQFHKNIFGILVKGGLAVHFFPTLYALPFFINYLAPERFAATLLNFFAPRDGYQHAKFPAYYHWCRGPTRRQIRKFKKLGYEIVEYRGYFGHGSYYNRFKFLKKLHDFKTDYLMRNPRPLLTSYAYVILMRP